MLYSSHICKFVAKVHPYIHTQTLLTVGLENGSESKLSVERVLNMCNHLSVTLYSKQKNGEVKTNVILMEK